jgi:hypothetical protein
VGFLSSIFSSTGKLAQLFKKGDWREFTGLALGSTFTTLGFIMSFFGGSSSSPDYGPILNSINQTVTATYEAVKVIQEELVTIAQELSSLSQQINTVFNALNTAILTTDCTTAYGTSGTTSVAPPARHNAWFLPDQRRPGLTTPPTPPRRQATCRTI